MTPASSPWLSTPEAAGLMGYSVSALRGWAKRRIVPRQYLERMPGRYLWHREFVARPRLLRVAPAEDDRCD